jgi:hypothetical protein
LQLKDDFKDFDAVTLDERDWASPMPEGAVKASLWNAEGTKSKDVFGDFKEAAAGLRKTSTAHDFCHVHLHVMEAALLSEEERRYTCH